RCSPAVPPPGWLGEAGRTPGWYGPGWKGHPRPRPKFSRSPALARVEGRGRGGALALALDVHVDDPLDRPAAHLAERHGVAAEHDAVELWAVEPVRLVAGALERADLAGVRLGREQLGLAAALLLEQRAELRGGRAAGEQLQAAPADLAAVRLVAFLVPRRGQRRAGLDEVLPLEPRRVVQRGDVRLPRLDVLRLARLVRHVGRVVLVRQPGEVVAELVDEDVLGELRVHRDGR